MLCVLHVLGGFNETTIVTCLLSLPLHSVLSSHNHIFFCPLSYLFHNVAAAHSIKTFFLTPGLFCHTYSLWLCLPFNLPVGQRGEPGAGPPAFEQPPGRRLGSQAAARPVYRDLCSGHWQHAAQPVPGGLVCKGLPSPSGASTTLCEHLPPGGSWDRKDTRCSRWQDLATAPKQCHHALYPLQTQSTQRGALPAEPSQDTHANVLPTGARRTHPRSQ